MIFQILDKLQKSICKTEQFPFRAIPLISMEIMENSIIQHLENRVSSHNTLDQQQQIVPLAILPALK